MKSLQLFVLLSLSLYIVKGDLNTGLLYHFDFNNNYNELITSATVTPQCDSSKYTYHEDQISRPNSAIQFVIDNSTGCNISFMPTWNSILDFTFTFWVKTAGKFSVLTTTDDNLIQIQFFDDNLMIQQSGSIGVEYNFGNNWVHVALIRDTTNLKNIIYMNGVEHKSQTGTNQFLKVDYFQIGLGDLDFVDGYLPMLISDFRVYDQIKDIDELLTMDDEVKIFSDSCSNKGLSVSDYVQIQIGPKFYCIKNDCVEQMASLQKDITLSTQPRIEKRQILYNELSYDRQCFDIYAKKTSDSSGTGDKNMIKNSYIKDCAQPCSLDFQISFAGSDYAIFTSTKKFTFTVDSEALVNFTPHVDNAVSVKPFPTIPVTSPSLLPVNGYSISQRQNSQFDQNQSGSVEMGTDIYYKIAPLDSNLALPNPSEIELKFVNPTISDQVGLPINPNQQTIEPDSENQFLKVTVKGRYIGELKLLAKDK